MCMWSIPLASISVWKEIYHAHSHFPIDLVCKIRTAAAIIEYIAARALLNDQELADVAIKVAKAASFHVPCCAYLCTLTLSTGIDCDINATCRIDVTPLIGQEIKRIIVIVVIKSIASCGQPMQG